MTLDAVAGAAGVTLQTVLRRFGSKDGLFARVVEDGRARIQGQRRLATPGDVEGAIANLVAHYEAWGGTVLRLLSQEARVPAVRAVTEEGRRYHREWNERVFGPLIAARRPDERRIVRAQLVAITDLMTWKLLRHDLALGRGAVERALVDLVHRLEGSL